MPQMMPNQINPQLLMMLTQFLQNRGMQQRQQIPQQRPQQMPQAINQYQPRLAQALRPAPVPTPQFNPTSEMQVPQPSRQAPAQTPAPQFNSGSEMQALPPTAAPTPPGGANNWFVQQLAAKGYPSGQVQAPQPVKQYPGMSSSYQMGQNGQPLLTYSPTSMSQMKIKGPT